VKRPTRAPQPSSTHERRWEPCHLPPPNAHVVLVQGQERVKVKGRGKGLAREDEGERCSNGKGLIQERVADPPKRHELETSRGQGVIARILGSALWEHCGRLLTGGRPCTAQHGGLWGKVPAGKRRLYGHFLHTIVHTSCCCSRSCAIVSRSSGSAVCRKKWSPGNMQRLNEARD
jgi:hypothetical protein